MTESYNETEYLHTLSLQAKKKVRTADEIPRISKFLSSNAMCLECLTGYFSGMD